MKKISTWVLLLLLFPVAIYGQTWPGDGTVSSPYQISSAEDMQALADEVKNGSDFSGEYFTVQQDISGISSVIGSLETPFKGIFDGNKHTLTVNISASGYIGLFGYIQDATIKQVKLAGTVNGDSDADGGHGGLVGYSKNGIVENCHNSAMLNCDYKRNGGIVGYNEYGTIRYCTNSGPVSGTVDSGDRTGGICGYNEGGVIMNCSNSGKVCGDDGIGGIVGRNEAGGSVRSCSNSGAVNGDNSVAGIVGEFYSEPFRASTVTEILHGYNEGEITGSDEVAGIAGEADHGLIQSCYNVGCIICSEGNVYGIANSSTATLENCSYLKGTIVGSEEGVSAENLVNEMADAFTPENGWASAPRLGINGEIVAPVLAMENEEEEPDTPEIPDYPDYYNIYADNCEGADILLSTKVVKEGTSMTFTIEIAEGYTGEAMKVYFTRGLYGYKNELQPDEAGVYEIRNIYTEIYIYVEGIKLVNPTGVEEISGIQVYTKDGSIFFQTPQQEQVMILSMNGMVVKNESQIGLKQYTGLQRGIYIIRIGEERVKVVI